jgi:hypothetical protein
MEGAYISSGVPRQQLVDKYAQRPPIRTLAVSLLRPHYDLGCQVLGCAAEGECAIIGQFLSKPKIGDLHVSLAVDQQVLWLQVAIHDVLLMHVADGQQDLADIEHGHVIAKPPVLPQPVEELPSRAELEDHVDKGVVLEGSLEGVDEGVVQLSQDLLLQLYMLHLLQIYDVRLRNLLQGQHLLRRTHDLLDPSEGARSQRLSDLVFGDVIRVTILLDGTLGLGLPPVGVGPQGRTHFFLLALLLQFL